MSETFKEESLLLMEFCRSNGFVYESRNIAAPEYQLARITGNGVVIIAYPHKTSPRNIHIRLRDGGSKNKDLCVLMMYAIYNSKPNPCDCTFQHKGFDHNKARELRSR